MGIAVLWPRWYLACRQPAAYAGPDECAILLDMLCRAAPHLDIVQYSFSLFELALYITQLLLQLRNLPRQLISCLELLPGLPQLLRRLPVLHMQAIQLLLGRLEVAHGDLQLPASLPQLLLQVTSPMVSVIDIGI